MKRLVSGMLDQHLLLAAMACLIASVAFGLSGVAHGYEISIYDSLPPLFWLALTGAFVLFSAGLIHASAKPRNSYKAANLLGLTALNLFMVALPTLKYGTYYTQWDTWIYLGQASSIARLGHVDLATNFYPSIHLIWVSAAESTGVSVYNFGQFLGAPIEALKVPLTFVLCSRLFEDRRVPPFAAVLSGIPGGVLGTYPSPWIYSLTLFMTLAVVLPMRMDRPGIATAVLTMIVATAFAISHPLGPVFLTMAVALQALWAALRRPKHKATRAEPRHRGMSSLASSVVYLIVIYVVWIGFLTFVLRISVSQLVEAVGAEGVVSPVVYGRFFTASLVLRTYGAYGVLGIYWLVGLLILRNGQPRDARSGTKLVVSVTVSGLILGIVSASVASQALLSGFITRPLDVLILFLPILAGLFLARSARSFRGRGLKTVTTYGAIVVPFLLAAAAVYPSPYVALFNAQNTQQLYASADWSAENLPQDAVFLANSHVGRYAAYQIIAGDNRYTKLYSAHDTLPMGLSQLSLISGNRTYILVDRETVSVAGMDLRAWSFPTPDDLAAIQEMEGVAAVYDNGEVQIFSA